MECGVTGSLRKLLAARLRDTAHLPSTPASYRPRLLLRHTAQHRHPHPHPVSAHHPATTHASHIALLFLTPRRRVAAHLEVTPLSLSVTSTQASFQASPSSVDMAPEAVRFLL